MTEDERITALIRELQDLHVREAAILQEIESRNRRRRSDSPVNETRTDQETEPAPRRRYQAGDRIYITNRVRRPAFAPQDWTLWNERRATVTRVVRDRVYCRTDNGTQTWRLHHNVRPLDQQAQ